ncbi:MAG: HIRAN domain-containing protein [Ruminococcus sp.]|nr:HIRAN domain-containing protein [Ruminococcus sp.]
MQDAYFITITGLNHYYGKKPFEIGRIFKIIKEPDNDYDNEAICAFLPFIEKIGYVANSTNTVFQGTISAGRLYDKIDDYAYARTMFITHSSVIALVLDKDDVENSNEEKSENKVKVSGKKKSK